MRPQFSIADTVYEFLNGEQAFVKRNSAWVFPEIKSPPRKWGSFSMELEETKAEAQKMLQYGCVLVSGDMPTLTFVGGSYRLGI